METITVKTEKNITNFINSWISIFVFSIVIVLVSIIQILIFTIGGGTISGFNPEDKLSWVAWVYLLISLPFGLASVIGMIYSIRGHSNFLIYAIIVEIGYFVSGLSAGMMFSALAMVLFLFMNIARYWKIKKEGSEYKINTKLVHSIMFVLITMILLFGVVSIELDTNHVFWWNTNVYGDSNFFPYLDVVTAAFTLAGVMMMLSRNKFAYVSFIICDVLFLILFINAHQWSNLVVTAIYIIVEILGFIVWHNKEEKTES